MKIVEKIYESEFEIYLNSIGSCERKNYIKNRVINEIQWYSKKSSGNQKWYKRFMIMSLILSSAIPLVTVLSEELSTLHFKVIISVLGTGVTAISTIIALYSFKELWIQYRYNSEVLKSQLHCYFTRSGEYKDLEDNEAFNKLVEECEKQINDENSKWEVLKNKKISNK